MHTQDPALHRLVRHLLAVVAVAGLLAGCGGASSGVAPPKPGDPSTTAGDTATASSTPSPTGSAAATDRMAVPAKRAGPLSGRDMPRPAALGGGWRFRVDSGNQEDGYAGNGTPTVQRDPSEVAGLAVPMGCVDRGHLPQPRWALESDYVHSSTRTLGLAIRLRFATAADAAAFMTRRDAALAACAAQTSSTGPNSTGLVQHLRRVAGLTVSTRTEAGDVHDGSAWTEVVRGESPATDVTMVAVNAPQSVPVARRAVSSLSAAR